jgi:large subunit ribosomal protein L24
MSKPKVRIHKDDVVVVIAGKNKGRTGKVLRVLPTENRVVVEGVAMVKRHMKGQGEQPGRIVEREASIHVSNVALWDSENNKRRKVSLRRTDDGLVRVDRKSGQQV